MLTKGPGRTHKVCGRCKEAVPLSEYNRRKQPNGQWGVHSYCKSCNKNNMREWYYGMERGEYEALEKRQEGLCAICGGLPEGSYRQNVLHIDHDHTTGRVRELLCWRCNLGIGYFGDDPERLRAAADYIVRHREGGQ